MSFIAIDLGTSFIKGAVLDVDNFAMRHIRRLPFPDPIASPDPQRVEYDCGVILDAVNQLLLQLEEEAQDCEGIVMCTQMSCLVMLDGHGQVRSNCIGWRDQRALDPYPRGGGTYYDVMRQRITPQQGGDLGNECPPGAPMSFLFWMAEKKMLEPGLVPVSLADFVLSAICHTHPTVEATNAMAYELLDLTKMQWHDDVIHEMGLEQLAWPPILQHGEVVGTAKIRGKNIPCYTAVGDYQCALVGALLTESELSLNISTGSQVSRLTSNLSLGNYQTRPFFDGKFTNTLSHLPAGRSLNVLVNLVTELSRHQGFDHDPWEYISHAASAAGAVDLKVNLGFFPGPCGLNGGITNIRESNFNVGTIFRAAFENMAHNYYACADRIWPERAWQNIVFSGGVASKLDLLRSLIESKIETHSRLCPVEEDTLLGLTALALCFSHRVPSVEKAMDVLRDHFAKSNT